MKIRAFILLLLCAVFSVQAEVTSPRQLRLADGEGYSECVDLGDCNLHIDMKYYEDANLLALKLLSPESDIFLFDETISYRDAVRRGKIDLAAIPSDRKLKIDAQLRRAIGEQVDRRSNYLFSNWITLDGGVLIGERQVAEWGRAGEGISRDIRPSSDSVVINLDELLLVQPRGGERRRIAKFELYDICCIGRSYYIMLYTKPVEPEVVTEAEPYIAPKEKEKKIEPQSKVSSTTPKRVVVRHVAPQIAHDTIPEQPRVEAAIEAGVPVAVEQVQPNLEWLSRLQSLLALLLAVLVIYLIMQVLYPILRSNIDDIPYDPEVMFAPSSAPRAMWWILLGAVAALGSWAVWLRWGGYLYIYGANVAFWIAAIFALLMARNSTLVLRVLLGVASGSVAWFVGGEWGLAWPIFGVILWCIVIYRTDLQPLVAAVRVAVAVLLAQLLTVVALYVPSFSDDMLLHHLAFIMIFAVLFASLESEKLK